MIFKSLLAGVMISIGGLVVLNSPSYVAGAIFFTVALYSICLYDLPLYTGKVGYLLNDKDPNALNILGIILFFNILGTAIMGIACRGMVNYEVLQEIYASKDFHSLLIPLVKSYLCGTLMFMAVENYRKGTDVLRVLGIFVMIPAFILAGLEHSIATAFFLAVKGAKGIDEIAYVMLIIGGNSIGALITHDICNVE